VSAGWGFVLLALLAGPAETRAGEHARVSVVVILASESRTKVDSKLESVAREVRKLYPRLTGFRLEKISSKSLTAGKPERFDLVAGQTATVTLEHTADAAGRIQLRVRPPLLGEITYNTACGKFLPIVTPFRTKDREVLILAVCAQTCRGK
jgi:hypothetical protein